MRFSFRFAALLITAFAPHAGMTQPHTHGAALANVAVDGGVVHVEMQIPAADALGFEHEARTDAQKARVADIRQLLEDPARVFRLDQDAGCDIRVVEVEIGPDAERHIDGHDDAHDHDDHETHGEDAHHDEDTDHAEDEEAHSDLRAVYSATCADPSRISTITFAYFEQGTATTRLTVRAVGPAGATARDLTANDPSMELSQLAGGS